MGYFLCFEIGLSAFVGYGRDVSAFVNYGRDVGEWFYVGIGFFVYLNRSGERFSVGYDAFC